MRTFIIVWLGQTISLIGSSMTVFAFSIWVWELTGQATALSLFSFFALLPQLLVTPIAGIIVDRWNRKYLMMLGDLVSGLLTITILLLYLTENLQLWHLYLVVAVKSAFEQFQELAYSASISTMVPKQHYDRANSIGFLANSTSLIVAPALAGVLYTVIGIAGILIIDITTFAIAVSTILLVHIPQPAIALNKPLSRKDVWYEIIFGFQYIFARPQLMVLLVWTSLFWFANDLGDSVYSPMILARTNNNAAILGNLASAAGIGGIVGALLLGSRGGFKRRIHGVFLGMVGAGLGKVLLGLSHTPLIWIPSRFFSSLNFPLLGSSNDAIWQAKVQPEVQGRVFATHSAIMLFTSTVASFMAGLLADYIFEPAMMPTGSLASLLGGIFGTGKGAGMGLMYVISSLGLLVISLSGYAFRTLRNVEIILPDPKGEC
ncbi:MAG: MFS transporter [Desmonostoc vinosum HA7617-LM4]|jgi:hypothetical protein|nr:MFS transporter [Desmonostoc vinosum HA7617-LM4]